MILQALTEYYKTLTDQGEISPPGWGEVKVSYALCIGADGTLEQVVPVQTEQTKGKKTVLAPQLMRLPAPVKRSSGVSANFLCDNSSYILGVDNKGNPQRSRECFEACRALHEQILEHVDAKAAQNDPGCDIADQNFGGSELGFVNGQLPEGTQQTSAQKCL